MYNIWAINFSKVLQYLKMFLCEMFVTMWYYWAKGNDDINILYAGIR